MNIVSRSWVVLMAGLAACGGGGGDGGTEPPPSAVFTSLAVSPANPNMVDGDTLQMTATPRDQNGAAMTGLPAATFEVVPPGTAVSVSGSGQVIAQQAGAATIRASLTSGGTTKDATANATVRALDPTATVAATTGNAFNPDTVKIATNGQVTWNFGTTAHNVTFQNPPAPVANLATQASSSEARVFATNGRYLYHCTIHSGMDGVVIVRSP